MQTKPNLNIKIDICKSGNFRENIIFANSMPREFKVLANKEFLQAIKTTRALVCEFKTWQIIRKYKICEISHAKISGFTVVNGP